MSFVLFFFFFFFFVVESIRIDLPRTFPENVFFENIRTPLFNVLVAYANHNKEIGYCQGLNYIAGECFVYAYWTDVNHFHLKLSTFPLNPHLRFDINRHKKWGVDILVAENPRRRHRTELSYENDARPHRRYRCFARIDWHACAGNLWTFGPGGDAISSSHHQMVHLHVFRGAASGNGATHLGLPIFGRRQSEIWPYIQFFLFFSYVIWLKLMRCIAFFGFTDFVSRKLNAAATA